MDVFKRLNSIDTSEADKQREKAMRDRAAGTKQDTPLLDAYKASHNMGVTASPPEITGENVSNFTVTTSAPVTLRSSADIRKELDEMVAQHDALYKQGNDLKRKASGGYSQFMGGGSAEDGRKAQELFDMADGMDGRIKALEKELEAAYDKEGAQKFSLPGYARDIVQGGIQDFATGLTSAAAMAERMTVGKALEGITGDENIYEKLLFKNINDVFKKGQQQIDERAAENLERKSDAWKSAYGLGKSAVAAIPQAVVAAATAGGSLGTQGLQAASIAAQASPGIAATMQTVATSAVKNPNYWTAFMSTVGNDFEHQIAKGYTDNQAALYATLTGLINAGVEIGGGIQTLPGQLANGGEAAFEAWFKSMIDEGKEEVLQGIVSRGMENLVLKEDNALFSTTDENAVFNPKTAAKEFGGGAFVGGLLGGGQTIMQQIANARANSANGGEMSGVEARTEVQADTDAPVAQNAVQSAVEPNTQSAATEGGVVQRAANMVRDGVGINRAVESITKDPAALAEFSAMNGVDLRGMTNKEVRRTVRAAVESALNVTEQSVETAEQTAPTEQAQTAQTAQTAQAEQQNVTPADVTEQAAQQEVTQSDVTADEMAQALFGENAPAPAIDEDVADVVRGAWPQNFANNEQPNDLPGSMGAARTGFTTPTSQSQQEVSYQKDTAQAYTGKRRQAVGATNRVNYDERFNYDTRTEEQSQAAARDNLYVKVDGQDVFVADIDPVGFDEMLDYLRSAPAWNDIMSDTAYMVLDEMMLRSTGTNVAPNIIEQGADAVNNASGEYGGIEADARVFSVDEVDAWSKTIIEKRRESARGVQAGNKWSRKGASSIDIAEAVRNINDSKADAETKTEMIRKVGEFGKGIDEAYKDGNKAGLMDIILQIADARGTTRGLFKQQNTRQIAIARSCMETMSLDELLNLATTSATAYTTDANPVDIGLKAKAVQVLNMFSNPKTVVTNITGNTSFYGLDALAMRGAAILDMAVGNITGTRSVAMEQSVFSKQARDGISEAIRKSIVEITLDVDMGGRGRYGTGGNRTFKMSGNILERFLSTCERNMGYALTTTDEAYKGAARSTAASTQKLVDEGKIRTSNKNYAEDTANDLALYRTFQNDGVISTALGTIHDVLNMIAGVGDSGKKLGSNKVHSFGLGDLVSPVTRVAGNLVQTSIDYNPAKAVVGSAQLINDVMDTLRGKQVTAERQGKTVSNIARGITGTALVYGFVQLAKAGLIRKADNGDDKDVAALNKSEGIEGTQINIDAINRAMNGGSTDWQKGDTLVDLSRLEPINFMLDLGCVLAENPNDGLFETVVDPKTYTDTAKSFASAAADLPVMSTVGDFAEDVMVYGTNPFRAGAEALGKTAISSVTPNVLAAIAKGRDDKQRSTYSKDELTSVLIDTLKSRIPGLRETLPTKVDTLGREVSNQENDVWRMINSVVNPLGVNTLKRDRMTDELERVRTALEDRGAEDPTSFFPTTRKPSTVSYTDSDGKSHDITLTYEQKQKYQEDAATAHMAAIDSVTSSKLYKSASVEMQQAILDQAKKYGSEYAKKKLFGTSDAEAAWARNARTAKQDLGISMGDYFYYYKKYGDDVFGNRYDKSKRLVGAGLSIDQAAAMNTKIAEPDKKASVEEYIISNFPDDQRYAIFDAYKGNRNWKNPF